MKKRGIFIKLFAVLLALLTVFPMLVSCKKNEKAVVGTVNGSDVYYDELYFLVNSYKASILEDCGGNEALARQQLYDLVMEDIVANQAILALCADYGLELDSVKSEVKDQVALIITQNFANNEKAFRQDLEKNNITEHYLKFVTGVDLLYSKLPEKYEQSGKIKIDEDSLVAFAKENFIRVNHIVRFNDTADKDRANLKKMNEALESLRSGDKSMYDLIASGYSQAFDDPSGDGYLITKGAMRDDYEAVAFALEVGEISDVFKSRGKNNNNEYVDCYYIIERLELSDRYIEENFYKLKTEYINTSINAELEAKRESLEFSPKQRFFELDLLNLPKPRKSLTVFGLIMIIVGSVAVVAFVVLMIIRKNTLKKKNLNAVSKKNRK
ncbi:MAG: hypothetical protein E7607_03035 [Ruminococcaceae bacterium]|nr:hypothetical protein [Oscillospiraceae bacterium]